MLTEGNTLVTEKTILSILYGSRDTNHLLPLSTETITFEQVTNSRSLQIVSVFFTEKSSPNFRCWSFAIRVNKYRFKPPSFLSSLFSSIWFFHWNLTNICLFTILKVHRGKTTFYKLILIRSVPTENTCEKIASAVGFIWKLAYNSKTFTYVCSRFRFLMTLHSRFLELIYACK